MENSSSGSSSEGNAPPNSERVERSELGLENTETLHLSPERIATISLTDTLRAPQIPGSAAGKRFGSYTLIRRLGEGGFGQVWEAESVETGRRVALKVLTVLPASSPHLVERFKQEGRLAASLTHPHCVYIFGAEEIEGYPAISMELMPGGTLQDLINAKGPLPMKQAVDYILNIIDGLEAAQKIGIIHRDVKPSNCFLDADGRAKVGDFGLSKTLESDTKITVTGTYLGTPAYSSPEQVRGRDLDFRSDMYAVGATLYALLTGKPPFEGTGAGEVLARIVSEEPTPFEDHKVDVPKGLQKVVRRTLAKEKEKRYPSYAALRAALTPYSSEGLTAASQGQRFAALLIDALALAPLEILIDNVIKDPLEEMVITPALWFSYFFLSEKFWGCSLGKYLLRLRVTTTEGAAMTFGQALLRTFVFIFFLDSIEDVANYFLRDESLAGWFLIGGGLALVLAMRRRNGYAGLHELVSGTRVRSICQTESTAVPEMVMEGKSYDGEPRMLGAYRITKVIWETEKESLLVGYDERLDRQVWIHRFHEGSSARPMPEMAASGPNRLYWLQGARVPENNWDAYEVPSGTSFLHWVRTKGHLSWAEMRRILLGLTMELKGRFEEDDRPREVSLHHIWVDATGQPKLLDFPVEIDGMNDGMTSITPATWRQFLYQTAWVGLEGRLANAEQMTGEPPRVPLPEYVRPLMDRLCGKEQEKASLAEVVKELQALADRPAKISRALRFALFTVAAALPLGTVIYTLINLSPLLLTLSQPVYVRDIAFTQTEGYEDLKKDWEQKQDESSGTEQRAVRLTLASSYAQFKTSPYEAHFKSNFYLRLYSLPEADLEAALREFPTAKEDELTEARKEFDRVIRQRILNMASVPLAVLILLAVPAIILSFILRGGALLSLCGVVVQTKDGRRAGRFRCLVRALVGWVPWAAVFFVIAVEWGGRFSSRSTLPLGTGLVLVLFAGVIYSLVKSERGLPDLIVGTHLVPR